jgi:hypothetical protein
MCSGKGGLPAATPRALKGWVRHRIRQEQQDEEVGYKDGNGDDSTLLQ